MSEYLEKLRSIGYSRGAPSKQVVERTDTATVITTVRDEGQDVTVRPDPIRMKARLHRTGSRKGEVAEARLKTPKELKADGQG